MLNCKEFTLLAAKMEEEKQPLSVRFNFAFHKLLCKSCASFVREFKFLSQKLKLERNIHRLTDMQKEKIIAQLETASAS